MQKWPRLWLLLGAKWPQLWAIGVENDPCGAKVDFVARWHARVTGQRAKKRSSVSQCRAGMGSQTLVFPQRESFFFQRGNGNEQKMVKPNDSCKSFRKTTTAKGRQGRKRYKTPATMNILRTRKTKTNTKGRCACTFANPSKTPNHGFPQRGCNL